MADPIADHIEHDLEMLRAIRCAGSRLSGASASPSRSGRLRE